MSVAELVGKVKSLARKRAADKSATYAETVLSAATGKTLDPVRVAEVLDTAGKTGDEFEQDVAAKAERLRLRAVADAGPKAEQEQAAERAVIARLDKKLADFADQVRAEAAPHHQRVQDLDAAIRAASTAETELAATYPKDGPVRVRLAELSGEVTAAEGQVKKFRDMLKDGKANAVQCEDSIRRHPGDSGYTDELAKLRARVAGYEAELTAADREYRRLIDEQARTFELLKLA